MTTAMLPIAVGVLCLVLGLADGGEAASRKACKPSACRTQIDACQASSCTAGTRRQQRRCRKQCKKQVTRACRSDAKPCDGGGGGRGVCASYAAAATCPARTLEPLRARNPVCVDTLGSAQPCDVDFETKFRVRSPWRAHEGECCVVDTCHGATSFGIYDNLASTGVVPPGQSPVLAPVTVTAQALSSYFQRPAAGAGPPGQWNHHTSTIIALACQTPPLDRVTSVAGGALVATSAGDLAAYETHPVPPPTGTWDQLALSPDLTSVSYARPRPPLLPDCGSVADTAKCHPRVFALENVNFPGDRNPVVEVLSESIAIDRLCDDQVFASARGTFRRQDGSECSVEIHARAKIGCASDEDCIPGEVCTTTDPAAPGDFGTAFPGWVGQSCLVPVP